MDSSRSPMFTMLMTRVMATIVIGFLMASQTMQTIVMMDRTHW